MAANFTNTKRRKEIANKETQKDTRRQGRYRLGHNAEHKMHCFLMDT